MCSTGQAVQDGLGFRACRYLSKVFSNRLELTCGDGTLASEWWCSTIIPFRRATALSMPRSSGPSSDTRELGLILPKPDSGQIVALQLLERQRYLRHQIDGRAYRSALSNYDSHLPPFLQEEE